MSTLLLILGLIFIVAAPIFSHLYFYGNIKNSEDDKKIIFFSVIPGIVLICIGFYLKQPKVLNSSVECGVVHQYKTFQIRHTTFERLAIVMDQSGYIRYFDFNENLPRLQTNEHVCFVLHDRFKNRDLSQSTILKIIDN